jgi:hypothetical protein
MFGVNLDDPFLYKEASAASCQVLLRVCGVCAIMSEGTEYGTVRFKIHMLIQITQKLFRSLSVDLGIAITPLSSYIALFILSLIETNWFQEDWLLLR